MILYGFFGPVSTLLCMHITPQTQLQFLFLTESQAQLRLNHVIRRANQICLFNPNKHKAQESLILLFDLLIIIEGNTQLEPLKFSVLMRKSGSHSVMKRAHTITCLFNPISKWMQLYWSLKIWVYICEEIDYEKCVQVQYGFLNKIVNFSYHLKSVQ